MEFDIDENHNHYVATSITFVIELLQKWIKSEVVEGVIALDGLTMVDDLQDIQTQVILPKIIERKDYVKAEVIAMVKTTMSAHVLCSKEEKFCNDNNIHVSLKNTRIEYTSKIGFSTGACVKIAAP